MVDLENIREEYKQINGINLYIKIVGRGNSSFSCPWWARFST